MQGFLEAFAHPHILILIRHLYRLPTLRRRLRKPRLRLESHSLPPALPVCLASLPGRAQQTDSNRHHPKEELLRRTIPVQYFPLSWRLLLLPLPIYCPTKVFFVLH
jgi:hypothetical protein